MYVAVDDRPCIYWREREISSPSSSISPASWGMVCKSNSPKIPLLAFLTPVLQPQEFCFLDFSKAQRSFVSRGVSETDKLERASALLPLP